MLGCFSNYVEWNRALSATKPARVFTPSCRMCGTFIRQCGDVASLAFVVDRCSWIGICELVLLPLNDRLVAQLDDLEIPRSIAVPGCGASTAPGLL